MSGYNLLELNRLAGPEPTLANYLQRASQPEPNMLAGPPMLPNVMPREMRPEPLGQSNLLHRFLQSFGQPSMDALQRGFEGKATPQEIARTFLETGPVGPFGAASFRRSPDLPAVWGNAHPSTSVAGRTVGERPSRPAAMYDDTLFVAPTIHGGEYEDAVRAMGQARVDAARVTDGFTTTTGRFLDRAEANQLADLTLRNGPPQHARNDIGLESYDLQNRLMKAYQDAKAAGDTGAMDALAAQYRDITARLEAGVEQPFRSFRPNTFYRPAQD